MSRIHLPSNNSAYLNDFKMITVFWHLLSVCRPDTIVNKQVASVVLEYKALDRFPLKYGSPKILLYHEVKLRKKALGLGHTLNFNSGLLSYVRLRMSLKVFILAT